MASLYRSHWLFSLRKKPPEAQDTDLPVSIFNMNSDILTSLHEVDIYRSIHILYFLVSFLMSIEDFSKETHSLLPYICILPYIILPYLLLCLLFIFSSFFDPIYIHPPYCVIVSFCLSSSLTVK